MRAASHNRQRIQHIFSRDSEHEPSHIVYPMEQSNFFSQDEKVDTGVFNLDIAKDSASKFRNFFANELQVQTPQNRGNTTDRGFREDQDPQAKAALSQRDYREPHSSTYHG